MRRVGFLGSDHCPVKLVLSRRPRPAALSPAAASGGLLPDPLEGKGLRAFGAGAPSASWSGKQPQEKSEADAQSDASNSSSDDPFNLRRFSDEQIDCFDQALGEIQSGKKRGHWIW